MAERRRLWWWEAHQRIMDEIAVKHAEMSREVAWKRRVVAQWDQEREDRDSVWEEVLRVRDEEEAERRAYERRLEKAMRYINSQCRLQRKRYLLKQSANWCYPQDLDLYVERAMQNPRPLYDASGQEVFNPLESLVVDVREILDGARASGFNTYDVIDKEEGFSEYVSSLYRLASPEDARDEEHGPLGAARLQEQDDEETLVGVVGEAGQAEGPGAWLPVEGMEGVEQISGYGAARDLTEEEDTWQEVEGPEEPAAGDQQAGPGRAD